MVVVFVVLIYVFVVSDFLVYLVYVNFYMLKLMIYKILGVWGNYEGLFLLWVLILILFGVCFVWFGGNLLFMLKVWVLVV